MATTLAIPSFADINLLERSTLSKGVAVNATVLPVESAQGHLIDQTIFVGTPGREGCEMAVDGTPDIDPPRMRASYRWLQAAA